MLTVFLGLSRGDCRALGRVGHPLQGCVGCVCVCVCRGPQQLTKCEKPETPPTTTSPPFPFLLSSPYLPRYGPKGDVGTSVPMYPHTCATPVPTAKVVPRGPSPGQVFFLFRERYLFGPRALLCLRQSGPPSQGRERDFLCKPHFFARFRILAHRNRSQPYEYQCFSPTLLIDDGAAKTCLRRPTTPTHNANLKPFTFASNNVPIEVPT